MTGTVPLDRRQRRRQETIEQVLGVAAEVMADEGVAGLTLGEVARRMGIRPPSLYVYFDSKHALYDALFERGWGLLLAALRESLAATADAEPVARLRAGSTTFVRWSVEHQAYAPLMFWRPVPGFTPSEAAYAPAVEVSRTGRRVLADLQEHGVLRPDVDLELAFRTWTSLTSGVVTQQLSNAPDESFAAGSFTSTLPTLIDMWLAHHAPAGDGGRPPGHRDRPPGGREPSPAGGRRPGDELEESR